MEMGLQPCGFLSAHLRSSLLLPDTDLYFRNLDGHGRIVATPDLRGRTVTNEVRMLSSVRGQGTILQSFAYDLLCDGQRFFEGEATFGYFRLDAMEHQVGLDGGTEVRPWLGDATVYSRATGYSRATEYSRALPGGVARIPPAPTPAVRQLQVLDDLIVVPDGGHHGMGYLYATGSISPRDWFFRAHFHQDPVMPGSLGVEAALQAMTSYARWRYPGFAAAGVGFPTEAHARWRYRGQITPQDRDWSLEVHIGEVDEAVDTVTLVGDVSVWKADPDLTGGAGRRIYEVSGLAVRLEHSEC